MDVQGVIRSEMNTLEGKQEYCQHPRKLQKKRLKWYGRVRRMEEEHIVRRILDMDIPGKEEEGGQTYGGKIRVREI